MVVHKAGSADPQKNYMAVSACYVGSILGP